MLTELPKFIDARRLIERDGTILGVISAQRLQRISSPYAAHGDIVVRASVSIADAFKPRMTGTLTTDVAAECQRCLEQMVISVARDIDLLLLDSAKMETRDELGDAIDFLPIIDGKIDIEQYVEDEVMLGVPMIPLHNNRECYQQTEPPAGLVVERKKPFTGLADLLAAAQTTDKS